MYDDIVSRGRRGTLRVAAVGILATLLVVAVVTALVLWLGTSASETATPVPAPDTQGGPVSAADPPPDDVAVILPTDLRWVEVAGVALPVSPTKGPRETTGGLARGFDRDPAGAVLAAVHIAVRINPQVGPEIFGPTLRDQVTGPHSPALRARVESVYETLRDQLGIEYGRPAGRIYATLIGFRVDQYTDTDVWLRLVDEGPDNRGGTRVSGLRLQLSWIGADWALVAPPNGDFGVHAVAVNSVDAYTLFVRD